MGFDETSQKLGELLAEAKTSQNQRAEIFRQIHKLRDETVTKREFDEFAEEAESILNDYKMTKSKVLGMVAVVSVVAAFGIDFVKEFI